MKRVPEKLRFLLGLKQQVLHLISKKNIDIIDVIVDGRFISGQINKPRLFFILKDRNNKGTIEQNLPSVSINVLTPDELFDVKNKALFFNGFSLLKSRFVPELIGYEPCLLISYSLTGLDQNRKTQFVYALHGRGRKQGMLQQVGGTKIGNSVIIVPRKGARNIHALFNQYDVDYKETLTLIGGGG